MYNQYPTSQSFSSTDPDDSDIIEFYNRSSIVNYKQRFGWLMGFRKLRYGYTTLVKSEGILDILGPKYLYLILDDFNASNNINFFNSSEESLLKNNILARISIKGYAYSIQSQTDLKIYSEPRYYYGPVDINKLSVRVVDEYSRVVIGHMIFHSLSFNTVYSFT